MTSLITSRGQSFTPDNPPAQISDSQTQFPISFLIQIPAVCQKRNDLLVCFSWRGLKREQETTL